MDDTIFLDSTPLGLICKPPSKPEVIACNEWLAGWEQAGKSIIIPGIIDYELRRELIRIGATAGLRRLDALIGRCSLLPISQEALSKAAELWALVRQRGQPTASDDSLDGDVILAAQARLAVGDGSTALIATGNVKHLNRLPGIDAREWASISLT